MQQSRVRLAVLIGSRKVTAIPDFADFLVAENLKARLNQRVPLVLGA
jgi:hypothetical protein